MTMRFTTMTLNTTTPLTSITTEDSEDHDAVVIPISAASSVSAAQRRRRHLAVYHRALRGARTPEQRAAVAARYRQLFVVTAAS